MSLVKKLVSSRYFPSASKPILTGLLAAGVTYGLHALGIYTVPADVQAAITPAVGLLAASVVSGPGTVKASPSVGSTIAGFLRDDLAGVIDANPDLLQAFTQSVIQRAAVVPTPPAPITAVPQVVPPPVFPEQMASPPAPHIEQ